MPNQPEYSQPGCSKDPPPAAQEQPPRLPEGQIVPPAVAGDDAEMLEPSTSANRSADVAGPSFMSRVTSLLREGLATSSCCSNQPVIELTNQPVPFSTEHARETHRLSKLITRIQCFRMPTSVKIKSKDAEKDLGICVRFKQECDQLCHRCEQCKVCPHQYSCDCLDDYKLEGGWCAHIHTMHTLTKGRYKDKMCLYIYTDPNYMLMRHLRAVVLGEDYMEKVNESVFKEALDNFRSSSKYKVRVIKPYPKDCSCSAMAATKCVKCPGCRCRFKCNCDDFVVDGRVCQHVHSVAMKREDRLGFSSFTLPRSDPANWCFVRNDWHLDYFVEMEHEMSFYIDKDRIKEHFESLSSESLTSTVQESDDDRVANAADFEVESAAETSLASGLGKSYGSEKRFKGIKMEWIVSRGNTEEEYRVSSNFCSSEQCMWREELYFGSCGRCEICRRNYTCSCPLSEFIICRHVHAVHRFSTKSQETKEEAARYIEKNYNRLVFLEEFPLEYNSRRFDPPPEGGGRGTDVLPPLTD